MRNILIILLAVSVFACSENKQKPGNTKESQLSEIKKLENVLKNSEEVKPDLKKIEQMVNLYEVYVNNFPNDSIAPYYLFQAGRLLMTSKEYHKAIDKFATVHNRYKNSKHAGMSLFMQAFVYETGLSKMGKAKELYDQFIMEYPEHEMVKDAKASIQNLGKTPEEIIKEFKLKNSSDSLS